MESNTVDPALATKVDAESYAGNAMYLAVCQLMSSYPEHRQVADGEARLKDTKGIVGEIV